MQRKAQQARRTEFGRNCHAGAKIPFPVARNGNIDRETDGGVSRSPAPFHEFLRQAAVLIHIDLEHLRARCGRCDILNRRRGKCRQAVKGPELMGGFGDGGLAFVMEQPRHAGRRQEHRPIQRHAQSLGRQIDGAGIGKVIRQKLVFRERLCIAAQGHFVVRTAVQVMKDGGRQAPPCRRAEVVNIEALFQGHSGTPAFRGREPYHSGAARPT